ncbi:MAG: hypothetical protein M5R42_20760 [Rhodocyclaceae bacterium]|nr:hypothetical protein [Rhodocyclaceae bacterium]
MVVAGEDIAAPGGADFRVLRGRLRAGDGQPAVGCAGHALRRHRADGDSGARHDRGEGPHRRRVRLARMREEIQRFVADQSEVAEVLNVITLAWGDKVVIAVKARMAEVERISGAQLVERINAVRSAHANGLPPGEMGIFEPDVR